MARPILKEHEAISEGVEHFELDEFAVLGSYSSFTDGDYDGCNRDLDCHDDRLDDGGYDYDLPGHPEWEDEDGYYPSLQYDHWDHDYDPLSDPDWDNDRFVGDTHFDDWD